MVSRRICRMLSTKVLRPLQPPQKVDKGIKTATLQQNTAVSEKIEELSPWSHFAAFNSMEDYVDTTLIQYNKEDEDSDKKP
ncbi:hypothetical protein P3T76_014835 [Phytophthora citrophthora]|uniref:Uncharacterized protein n=1 Tax=Phytophthora citrophthora TaxID=4793 RepID=A0AAD9LAR2_9STRA|nr:hypothetical protein P3T76_014835 [Phytophthora citrophthora]